MRSSRITTKLAQSTNPQVLSATWPYSSKARRKVSSSIRAKRLLGERRNVSTAWTNCDRAPTRASPLPVSAKTQSVVISGRPAEPNPCNCSVACPWKRSSALRIAIYPLVSTKTALLLGIVNLRVSI